MTEIAIMEVITEFKNVYVYEYKIEIMIFFFLFTYRFVFGTDNFDKTNKRLIKCNKLMKISTSFKKSFFIIFFFLSKCYRSLCCVSSGVFKGGGGVN